ncbi:MAG: hypothetical protein KTR31_07980 [Myxococcales bacterium]|nr:hypothetical protein [Myxococcales bacterium]
MELLIDAVAILSLTGVAGVAIGSTLIGAGLPVVLVVGSWAKMHEPAVQQPEVRGDATSGHAVRERKTA